MQVVAAEEVLLLKEPVELEAAEPAQALDQMVLMEPMALEAVQVA
jgi:hypothetical protein